MLEIILPFFRNEFEKFNNTGARILWKGLCDKILCIHVRLFKSVV